MRILPFFLLISTCSSLNFVLYLTLIGSSHLGFINSMIDSLLEKGHTVDVIIGVLNSAVKWEGKVKGDKVVAFGFDGGSPWIKTAHLENPFETRTPADFHHFYQICFELGKVGMESGIPLEFMKNKTYDAAIISDYDYSGFIYARAARIRKVMSFTSTAMMPLDGFLLGLPNPASLRGGNLDLFYGDISMIGKIKRLFHLGYQHNFYFPELAEKYNNVSKDHYGLDFPSADDIAKESDIIFINSNELIEVPRTITHKVKYIGGIARRKANPLTEEFENILSKSKKGVVLVSFGTLVASDTTPRYVKEALINAFKQFPDYTFIWKYVQQKDDEQFFNTAANVITIDWLPQNDLLNDKRVVGFISHVGLNSLTELTYAGVPVIAIPLVSDQMHNGKNVERLGIGVMLDKLTLTDKTVVAGLSAILNDKRYIKQSKHVAKMLADHPDEAKQSFCKWAEFVATHENIHKQYNLMEANLGFITYYCLDVIAVIVLIAVFAIYVISKILRTIFGGSRTKKIKSQ